MIGQDVDQLATGPGSGAGASCVRQLSVASFNVDRAGASKIQHTVDFARNFPADAYALQQIDITDLEMPRYVHSWRQAGLQIVLSQPELPNRSRRVGPCNFDSGEALSFERVPGGNEGGCRSCAGAVSRAGDAVAHCGHVRFSGRQSFHRPCGAASAGRGQGAEVPSRPHRRL